MRRLTALLCVLFLILATAIALHCWSRWRPEPVQEALGFSGLTPDDVVRLVDAACEELRAAKLPEKEIALRAKVIENVATGKAYFPPAVGGRPEYRNPKYWTTDEDGCFVPKGKPSEAIKDLWVTVNGVRCHKLSTLVLLKAMIDVADAKELDKLDDMLKGKVIPTDLPDEGVGTLFSEPDPKQGEIFQRDELLPGDEVWFDNPYFDRLPSESKRRYLGQEGHHVFYIGGGKVMDMYRREPMTIEAFRKTFLWWGSVQVVSDEERREPKAEEFQIKAVRRVILDRK